MIIDTLASHIHRALGGTTSAPKGERLDAWESLLEYIEKLLPSGSGIDSGTVIDRDHAGKLSFKLITAYHHMNDAGYYVCWTNHVLTVSPDWSADGFDFKISGRDRNEIKDYLGDLYQDYLSRKYILQFHGWDADEPHTLTIAD